MSAIYNLPPARTTEPEAQPRSIPSSQRTGLKSPKKHWAGLFVVVIVSTPTTAPMIVIVTLVMFIAVVVIFIVEVPVTIFVPPMIVLNPAAISVPVADKETLSVVMRCHPIGSFIRRSSPVTRVPSVALSHRIPIAFHPYELRPRGRRLDTNHAGRRWCAN